MFPSITGKRLSQPALSGYWGKIKARSGLEFDFYHATKHYGVHHLWTKLRLPRLAIAAQAGWSISTIDKMLAIYGHGEVGALEEVDAAFANGGVRQPHALNQPPRPAASDSNRDLQTRRIHLEVCCVPRPV